ncbi:MinD/ParA family ATP-binding protein [Desulfofalx alkaliphila]|uniref:MinD/ParA family ATP-binding protein n=1 Tax=Desulfofalx alkaliphila TaxID=105483 RepID=UPI0004E288AF|nr:hypothetical protein [Desulfofalx alkaliphila]
MNEAERLKQQIKEMSEYCNAQGIADALRIPVEAVQAILEGKDVEIEKTQNDDQPIIQLKTTTKTRFVRNNIVTAISPGGGKGNTTLLTSLAAAAAINVPNKRPVAILDLAEFPKVPTAYGIRYLEVLENPDILWPSISTWDDSMGYSIDTCAIPHPDLENLYIVPGVMVADNYHELDLNKILKVIELLQRQFEMLFIDLPKNFFLAEKLLPFMDTVLITVTPEYGSLEGVVQLLPTLNKVNKIEQSFIVFNRVGYPGFFDTQECQEMLKNMMKQMPERVGSLPETDSIIKYLNSGKMETVILKEPHSAFAKEVNHILNQLCPHWSIAKPSSGSSDGIASIFKKLLGKKEA